MRRVLIVTAAVLAAVIVFALATLPPRPQTIDTSGIDPDLIRRTIRGAYHVHTSRSDGASDKAAIAAAAARAGLKFVIFTDHGDGTAPLDPPGYLSGVLCIDGVEISTNGGHYVALGMRQAPYPLGGDPAAVVEDVARLGGFGIAAHPDSPKASLAWTDWEAPIDGIEWLSADSEWRDESRSTLAHAFLSYLFRPAPALASLLDRPVTTLKRWDEMMRRRPVVALAAHDAHGGIGRGVEEGGTRTRALGHVPSYEASFRTFSDNVILDAPLSGDAAKDGAAVIGAIRRGRVFTVVDAIAGPGYVDPRRSAGRFEVQGPGAPGTPPVPWLVANPVYSQPSASVPAAPEPRSADLDALAYEVRWHVEKDPRTTATLLPSSRDGGLLYTLAPGARDSQFAAVVAEPKPPVRTFTHIVLTASSRQPTRVSVQLRYSDGRRWGSSVYLDSTPREIVVPVSRLRPLDRQSGPAPDPATASSLLFVVDLTNAKPGDSGQFAIHDLRVGS